MTELAPGHFPSAHDFFADAIGPHNADEYHAKLKSFRHWTFYTSTIEPIKNQLKGYYVIFSGLRKTWVNEKDFQRISEILEEKPDREEYLLIKITEDGNTLVPPDTLEYWESFGAKSNGENQISGNLGRLAITQAGLQL
jgi:hypothetical protein